MKTLTEKGRKTARAIARTLLRNQEGFYLDDEPEVIECPEGNGQPGQALIQVWKMVTWSNPKPDELKEWGEEG